MENTGHISHNATYNGYPYYWNVLSIEKNFNFDHSVKWMRQNWHLSFYISVVYLAVVFGLQRYMRNQKPVDIRLPFMLWNIALSIFSTWGMCRMVPDLLFILTNYGFEQSVCNSNINQITGLWFTLFTFSKAVELVDTVFVVLRKRLTPLHVTHHVLAVTVTWYLMKEQPALTRWCAAFNFTVHSFMYAYFALKAANVHLPEMVSIGVTSLQILQFVVCCLASVVCFYFIRNGSTCSTSYGVATGLICMNAFFIYIFGNFFLQRYLPKKADVKAD